MPRRHPKNSKPRPLPSQSFASFRIPIELHPQKTSQQNIVQSDEHEKEKMQNETRLPINVIDDYHKKSFDEKIDSCLVNLQKQNQYFSERQTLYLVQEESLKDKSEGEREEQFLKNKKWQIFKQEEMEENTRWKNSYFSEDNGESNRMEDEKKIIKLSTQILMKNYTSQTFNDFEEAISHCIKIRFVPEPINDLGIKLLSSAKFVISYYQALLRGQNNPLLIDHCLNLIQNQLYITKHKNYLVSLKKSNETKKQKYLKCLLQNHFQVSGLGTDKKFIFKNRKQRVHYSVKR